MDITDIGKVMLETQSPEQRGAQGFQKFVNTLNQVINAEAEKKAIALREAERKKSMEIKQELDTMETLAKTGAAAKRVEAKSGVPLVNQIPFIDAIQGKMGGVMEAPVKPPEQVMGEFNSAIPEAQAQKQAALNTVEIPAIESEASQKVKSAMELAKYKAGLYVRSRKDLADLLSESQTTTFDPSVLETRLQKIEAENVFNDQARSLTAVMRNTKSEEALGAIMNTLPGYIASGTLDQNDVNFLLDYGDAIKALRKGKTTSKTTKTEKTPSNIQPENKVESLRKFESIELAEKAKLPSGAHVLVKRGNEYKEAVIE